MIGGLVYFWFNVPSLGAIFKSVSTSVEKECAKNPAIYGVDLKHLWKCSMFSPASLG